MSRQFDPVVQGVIANRLLPLGGLGFGELLDTATSIQNNGAPLILSLRSGLDDRLAGNAALALSRMPCCSGDIDSQVSNPMAHVVTA